MNTLYRKISATLLAVLFLATSCDNFDALENPNEPTVPIMSSMLTGAILSIGTTVTSTTGVHYVQHLANTQYTDDDNYQTVKFSFNGYYQTPMANLKTIIDYLPII